MDKHAECRDTGGLGGRSPSLVLSVPAYKCQLLVLQLSEPRLHGVSRKIGRVLLVGMLGESQLLKDCAQPTNGDMRFCMGISTMTRRDPRHYFLPVSVSHRSLSFIQCRSYCRFRGCHLKVFSAPFPIGLVAHAFDVKYILP